MCWPSPLEPDGTGNTDLFDFFAAPDADSALAVAMRRHVDIVLFGPSAIAIWLPDDSGIFLNQLKRAKSREGFVRTRSPLTAAIRTLRSWADRNRPAGIEIWGETVSQAGSWRRVQRMYKPGGRRLVA